MLRNEARGRVTGLWRPHGLRFTDKTAYTTCLCASAIARAAHKANNTPSGGGGGLTGRDKSHPILAPQHLHLYMSMVVNRQNTDIASRNSSNVMVTSECTLVST